LSIVRHASPRGGQFVACCLGLALAAPGTAGAIEQVTFKLQGQQLTIDSRLLASAQDGRVVLQGRDGVIRTVEPHDLLKCVHDDKPFIPYTPESLGKQMLRELPQGFSLHFTAHYVICYDTTKEYAQWCGGLFEQLYRAFATFWKNRGFKLHEPEFPLVAVVFAERRAYLAYSAPELGDAAPSIIGYYSPSSNRMTMYDLTGVEVESRGHRSRGGSAEIGQILAKPEAERTVATIVHEATHQIAFNCGLHSRISDCPRWFSEGIAMYFETHARGWGNIGSVNRVRLRDFQAYLPRRPADSLQTLLADDRRFSDAEHGSDAYAEAWTLTYFLIRQHPKQYVEYLKTLSQKKAATRDTAEKRLKEFTAAFGALKKLDLEFVRYVLRSLPG
jgi:hypothetical protein